MRAAALLATAALALSACGEAQRRPDVLLVVLDTVRADRCSAYGYARPTTIQLAAFAKVGALFEDVTAPGAWTVPSHASLFTGMGPWEHGADLLEDAPDGSIRVGALRAELPTLAERFAKAGYRTAAVAANDWLGPEFGLTRGFERAQVVRSDALAMEEVARELAKSDGRPLFLFVNLMTAHSPYEDGPGEWSVGPGPMDPATTPGWLKPYLLDTREPPSVHLGRETPPDGLDGFTRYLAGTLAIPPGGMDLLSRLYDAGVRGADFALGRLLEAWIARAPDSVVAVTSDHGEAFAEHGWVEHRGIVYPELVRVPLVIAAPGVFEPGTRVREPVQLTDLHDTLLELAAIEPASPSSLVAIAKGAKRAGPIAAQAPPYGRWKRNAGGRYAQAWRLYRSGDLALVTSDGGAAELYDVARDPAMRTDLAPQGGERLAALARESADFFAGVARPATGAVAIPAETMERLRALGYAEE
jgi:arylsulfatase A-like enzyme